jgi:hypothetical protein
MAENRREKRSDEKGFASIIIVLAVLTLLVLLKIAKYRDGVRRAEACKMDLFYPAGVTIFCNT